MYVGRIVGRFVGNEPTFAVLSASLRTSVCESFVCPPSFVTLFVTLSKRRADAAPSAAPRVAFARSTGRVSSLKDRIVRRALAVSDVSSRASADLVPLSSPPPPLKSALNSASAAANAPRRTRHVPARSLARSKPASARSAARQSASAALVSSQLESTVFFSLFFAPVASPAAISRVAALFA